MGIYCQGVNRCKKGRGPGTVVSLFRLIAEKKHRDSPHQTLPFLDVQVHLSNNHIETDLHTKPTDKHQYLLKTSCHPSHTKQTIPFSLFLRIRRICSNDAFFDNRSEELIKHLIKLTRLQPQNPTKRCQSRPRYPTSRNTPVTGTENHKSRPYTLCHILQPCTSQNIICC